MNIFLSFNPYLGRHLQHLRAQVHPEDSVAGNEVLMLTSFSARSLSTSVPIIRLMLKMMRQLWQN